MDFVVNEFNGYIPRQKWFVNKIIFSTRGLTLDIGCGIGLWSKKLREKI
jgi:predicted TPR repeat methyltransferase